MDDSNRLMIRIMDVAFTVPLLLFFSPLIVIVAALVWIVDPGPILFRHKRVGYQGKPFYCLKFRSMVVDAERKLEEVLASDPMIRAAWLRDHKLPSDPRITKIGKFLRASSLDELPQFFNVIRGEMSLVGPRPIVQAEVKRYGRYIANYYSVTPGITGLWQIGGRSDTSYRRRVALDVAFARARTPGLYLKILVLTVPAVLLARGSY
jgi:exopolysaccharide production protein ExoY